MPEAMKRIRAELGRDAMILHTEQVKSRGLLRYFRRPQLEVIAAVDTDLQDFPQPTPAADQSIQRMQEELTDLRTAVALVAESKNGSNTPPRTVSSLEGWYQRLLDQGVSQHIAQPIVHTVADELNRWTLDNSEVLNEHLHWHLGRRLRIATPLNFKPSEPTVLFLVGPTGVGKTTTLAKLAANYSRMRRLRALIVSTDTHRIGAISQIQAFGQVLDIPIEISYTPEQLAACLESNKNYDLILVDTPGKNQRVADQVADLGDYLGAVPHKIVYLTLTAGAKYEDLMQAVKMFGTLPLDGVVFTKLDETTTLGSAYTLACDTQLPVSYLTTGQRIPQDIEVATAERLVDSLVGVVPDKIRSTRALNQPEVTNRRHVFPQETL